MTISSGIPHKTLRYSQKQSNSSTGKNAGKLCVYMYSCVYVYVQVACCVGGSKERCAHIHNATTLPCYPQ